LKNFFLKSLDGVLYRAFCRLAFLLPKKPRETFGKTLVIRPGGMGDLICADIALENLGLDPHHFTWLIEGRSKPWAEYRGLPHLCYDVNPLKTLKQVWNRYALVINTEQYFGLTEAYSLLALTTDGRIASFITNRGSRWSDVTVSYDWRDEHETVAFGRLFAQALARPYAEKPRLPRARFHPPGTPPLVLIAGRQSPSRRLSLESWATLTAQWHHDRPFLIGAAPEDAEFADTLARHFAGLARRFEGSFSELCEQIARSEEIFTMDGGALHIASFFGVPVLALFTSGRDRKWLPLGQNSRILRRHDLPCQPCAKFGQVPPCPYQFACLQLEKLEPMRADANNNTHPNHG
jgi:ADP-heptose:LPS heptosyltransferase